MSTVINANVQRWRQGVLDGSITDEEMKEAVAAIRKERLGASEISAASRERKTTAKAKTAPIDSDDLLSQLGI